MTQTEANDWLFQKHENAKEEKKRVNTKRRLYLSLKEYIRRHFENRQRNPESDVNESHDVRRVRLSVSFLVIARSSMTYFNQSHWSYLHHAFSYSVTTTSFGSSRTPSLPAEF